MCEETEIIYMYLLSLEETSSCELKVSSCTMHQHASANINVYCLYLSAYIGYMYKFYLSCGKDAFPHI